MSIDVCVDCDAYVDTDSDGDCYVERGNMRRMTFTVCVCERCRDKEQDERDRRDAMDQSGDAA